jgi:hypothetical protein
LEDSEELQQLQPPIRTPEECTVGSRSSGVARRVLLQGVAGMRKKIHLVDDVDGFFLNQFLKCSKCSKCSGSDRI